MATFNFLDFYNKSFDTDYANSLRQVMDIEIELGMVSRAMGRLELSATSINKSDGAANPITVTYTLYAAAPVGGKTVYLYLSGGHNYDTENYGVGYHYTLTGADIQAQTWLRYNCSYVTLLFAAGQTTKTFTLTVFDNPVIELDRTITIYGAGIKGKTFIIVDDRRAGIVDVEPGIGTLAAAVSANVGTNTVLKLTAGEYRVNSCDFVPSKTTGLSIIGAGKTLTTLKRTANYHLRTVGYEEKLLKAYYTPTDANNSKPNSVSHVTIDGDQPTQGFYVILKLTYTIVDSNYVQYATYDMAGVTKTTYRFTWKDSPPEDDTSGSTKYYYMQNNANPSIAWTNFIDKLTALGYQFYRSDDVNYNRVMIETNGTTDTSNPSSNPASDAAKLQVGYTQGSGLIEPANTTTTYAGRNDFRLEQIIVRNNNPASGISIGKNSSCRIYYFDEDTSSRCGRGFIEMYGGYSESNIKQASGHYFHNELDSAGYNDGNGAHKCDLSLEDLNTDIFSYWPSAISYNKGNLFYANRLTVNTKFMFFTLSGSNLPLNELLIENSSITLDGYTSENYLARPGRFIFRNTIFTCKNVSGRAAVSVAPLILFRYSTGDTHPVNQYLKYQGCEFRQENITGYTYLFATASGWSLDNTEGCTIYFEKDSTTGNRCSFTGGTFTAIGGYATGAGAGGNNHVVTGVDTTNLLYVYGLAYNSSNHAWSLDIDGDDCLFNHSSGFIFFLGTISASTNPKYLRVQNCPLTYAQSVLNLDGQAWATAITRFSVARVDAGTGILRAISAAGAPVNGTTMGLASADPSNPTDNACDQYHKTDPASTYYYLSDLSARTWTEYTP